MPLTSKTKYLVIHSERFRSFLDNLVDKSTADEIIRNFEKRGSCIDLKPGDRVARQSDVQEAVKTTRENVRADAQRVIERLAKNMKPGSKR